MPTLLCRLPLRSALVVACPYVASAQTPSESYPPNAQLVESVEPFVKKQELAGAVMLVADKNKVLAVDTVGYADIAEKREMSPDALFWIASQSKSLTAAHSDLGRRRQSEARRPGRKISAGIADAWVAAEKDAKHMLLERPAQKITVRHVLSHTSGLPFKSALETPTLDGLPLAVAVRSYAATPLDYQPGTGYRYSNAGINTAGRIIEVVTGMT